MIRHHHIPNKPVLSKDTIHSIQTPNHGINKNIHSHVDINKSIHNRVDINNSIHNPVDISKGMAMVTNKQMAWYICSFVIRFV